MARINGYKVGVPRYNPKKGWSYVTVWVSTPGQPHSFAVRGPFPRLEDCRADLNAIK